MILQFSILTPILLIISLIFAVLAYDLRHIWDKTVRLPVTLFFVCGAVWAFGDAGIYAVFDPESQLAITTLSFIGISCIPVTLFLISCAFARLNWFSSIKRIALLFILPAVTIILVGTNSIHGLMYSGVIERHILGIIVWEVSYGPLYPIHILYSYVLIVSSMSILIYQYASSTPLVRRQIGLLFLGIIIPVIANLLYFFRLDPYPGIDFTPFSLLVTAGLIISGNIKIGLFRIVPLACKTIIESMEDGVLIMDTHHQIVDMNRSASTIIGDTLENLEGSDGRTILKQWGDPDAGQSVLVHRGVEQVYEVRSHAIKGKDDLRYGTIIYLRDITEIYRAQKGLEEANRKLHLLSSITRHDILNQITTALGYGAIIEEELPDTQQSKQYMRKLMDAVRTIKDQITFTADYENLGIHEPKWQHVASIAQLAKEEIDPGTISLDVLCGDLEIYSDPLFVKVFSNLFHNTITHGKSATRIQISFCNDGSDGILTVVDDGIGIPDDRKEEIFIPTHGSKSGLGLFLIREILSITNITIKETGVYGEGTQFEMRIPEYAYRNAPEEKRHQSIQKES